MASVIFDRVSKLYDNEVRAVADLTLEVVDGEFMVLVGPSGCGKTTALRMVAGLEEISDGEIRIGDTVVNDVDSRWRDVAMVFQNYALYPHMTVFDNIAFGLRVRRIPRREIQRRVEEIGRVLALRDLLARKPRQLSGGQRQRVAMGRAIVREPSVFLMDEPLSNLDARLRVQMRAEVSRIQHELGATTIYVTHDQVEAMTMGSRVAVMRKGELQQVAPPREIYEQPTNLFVATFIGSPSMNLVQGILGRDDAGLACRIGDQELPLPSESVSRGLEAYIGRPVAVGIRPEHVRESASQNGGDRYGRLRAAVTATEILGSELLVHAEIEAEPVVTDEVLEVAADVDVTALSDLQEEARKRRVPLLGRFDPAARVESGDTVELTVDPARLHFFDLETEAAIA